MKQKKLTRSAKLAASTAQDVAHLSTDHITRRRMILACNATALEQEIVSLSAQLANARDERWRVEAMLDGLATVVAKRSL